jgi:hypothetical protein
MSHPELPQPSAERVRTKIDEADLWLTNHIKWLPTELQDGKKTREEVEAILCEESKQWAGGVFITILREWATIGIPPDDFEAVAKDQIENLSTHAEERVAAFVASFRLTSGNVLQAVRQVLPGEISPYREENRFRFSSLSVKPATRSDGPETGKATYARASSSNDLPMESPTRIKFEAGLALAEVTMDQDLKDHEPSVEIARKYVADATLTLARCILTPDCPEPYEVIQRSYAFAEWFAGETLKTAWVWLCVFSEMSASGKLAKYGHEEKAEGSAPKEFSKAEMNEWHGCLYGFAHEALDEFVAEFWKERFKHFSEKDALKTVERLPIVDSDFWRSLSAQFRALDSSPDSGLSATWTAANAGVEWTLIGDESTQARFLAAATDAGARLDAAEDSRDGSPLWARWLNEVKKVARESDLVTVQPLRRCIADIRRASAACCDQLQTSAREAERASLPRTKEASPQSTATRSGDIPPEDANRQHRREGDLAAKRRHVVMPVLKHKRWTRGKWASEAGVGKNCVYEYLGGKRNPAYENRKAMADALGLKVEDLPE